MNTSPISVAVELWKDAPRWRTMLVSAMASSILAIIFWPSSSGAYGNSPSGSYSPPSGGGALVPPPIPTSSGNAPVSRQSAGSKGNMLNTVPPAPPPRMKIAPGEVADGSTVTDGSKSGASATAVAPRQTAASDRKLSIRPSEAVGEAVVNDGGENGNGQAPPRKIDSRKLRINPSE